ncbi:MAG: hypothetical protein HKN82_06950 [Akkermansiaceae bacterium]|nr:hypothetical protein [Akkermansiaceae bacterium]NNM30251.1 hypothetical protein [Akkermansiaceae bacterium]
MNAEKTPCLALLGLAVLLAASCAPVTPAQRIVENPQMFAALSPRHQELVRSGRIGKGMPKDGVFLAWGRPDRRADGFRDGSAFERWDFTALRPVYYQGISGYYGHGWGRRGHRHGYYGLGYSPTVEYVPYRVSSVWFRKDLVDSWERFNSYR